MTRSRLHRRERDRSRTYRTYAIAGAVAVALALAGFAATSGTREPSIDIPASLPATAALEVTATATDSSIVPSETVEVPDVVGRSAKEAQLILSAAGLLTELHDVVVSDSEQVADDVVLAQEPGAGSLVMSGGVVTISIPSPASERRVAAEGVVVCIDPGHQSHSDSDQEPVGPGAAETKQRVTGGTTGVSTRVPEYEIALQISMNLKQRLEAEGITVVMTRSTNDVDLSNSERAQIANEAGASLFVRVHADGSTNPDTVGVSTLYPASNPWTAPHVVDSERAASLVHEAVVASTGAVSRGTVARQDIAGFNWSKVPCLLVECGFMSNPVEDKLLSSPHYQDKLADGMTRGILSYLGRQ